MHCQFQRDLEQYPTSLVAKFVQESEIIFNMFQNIKDKQEIEWPDVSAGNVLKCKA